jgi:hypothetical protein
VSCFLVRRAVIALVIGYLRDYLFLQLELYMLTSLVCLGFLVVVKPYENTLNNVLEMINEALVITTIYILHSFSLVPKGSQRFKIGWFYLALIAAVVLLNLAINLFGAARYTY